MNAFIANESYDKIVQLKKGMIMIWGKDKKPEKTENEYIVTFYFVSGEKTQVSYTKELFDDFVLGIRKNWNDLRMSNDKYGINLSHVTHYEVKEG